MGINAGANAITGVYLGDQLLTKGGGDEDYIKQFAKLVPGADTPTKGDWDWGYFGTVAEAELGAFDAGSQAGKIVTATTLANQVGLTKGQIANGVITWHKFAYRGEIMLIPQKEIRRGISWIDLAKANCVCGTNIQSIGGNKYRITLLSGYKNEYCDENYMSNDQMSAKDNEFNNLVYSLKDGTFAHLTLDELTDTKIQGGSSNWCKNLNDEEFDKSKICKNRVCRGLMTSYSFPYVYMTATNDSNLSNAWRPALRFVP